MSSRSGKTSRPSTARLQQQERELRQRLRMGAFAGTVALACLALPTIRHAAHECGGYRSLARTLYRSVIAARGGAHSAAFPQTRADAPLTIYEEGPGSGWRDWSWATHDAAFTGRAHTGGRSLKMTPEGWKGILFHHDPISTAGYGALQIWACGDAELNVCLVDTAGKWGRTVPLRRYLGASTNGWALASIPLADIRLATGDTITGVVFQADGALRQTDILLDDIALIPDTNLPPAPRTATVAVSIDAEADRHPISPFIYGVAHLPEKDVAAWRIGSHRWGGNANSRYNWVANSWNSARDWEWRNTGANLGLTRPGQAADDFVRADQQAGVATYLTVPALGWVARDGDNEHRSLNVPADGATAGYDPTENRKRTSVRSQARKGASFVDAPDPNSPVVYQDEWIYHLVHTFGDARHGGVRFYAVDNEPDLWSVTHTDVHPERMGYDDVLNTFTDYASAIKAVDPSAEVAGPVAWGWTGYFYSALDKGDDNYHTHADRTRHGGEPFLGWFLKRMREHDARAGARSLDILDVHYYPQAAGVYSAQSDPATRALRLRTTRSLWDPAYVDESWIGEPVRLLPRLKEWVAADYPGTKIGIGEWSFGADGDISGGLAIADTLGIFGREGVYLADYWTHPAADSPGYRAFQLYRNADSNGLSFGDISCRAKSEDSDRVSCFAAMDTKTGALTAILINKMPKATVTVPLSIAHYGIDPTTPIRLWRFSEADPTIRSSEASGPLQLTLPPYSATLVRLGKGGVK